MKSVQRVKENHHPNVRSKWRKKLSEKVPRRTASLSTKIPSKKILYLIYYNLCNVF